MECFTRIEPTQRRETVGPTLVALAGYDRAVATAPGQAAIEAVARPLEFAARDDFARADRVVDLEKSVVASASAAAEAAIPKPAKDALRAVRDAFAQPLSAAELRPAIEKALTMQSRRSRMDPNACRDSGRSGPRHSRSARSAMCATCSFTSRRATTIAARWLRLATSRSDGAPPSWAGCWVVAMAPGAAVVDGAGACSRRLWAMTRARST